MRTYPSVASGPYCCCWPRSDLKERVKDPSPISFNRAGTGRRTRAARRNDVLDSRVAELRVELSQQLLGPIGKLPRPALVMPRNASSASPTPKAERPREVPVEDQKLRPLSAVRSARIVCGTCGVPPSIRAAPTTGRYRSSNRRPKCPQQRKVFHVENPRRLIGPFPATGPAGRSCTLRHGSSSPRSRRSPDGSSAGAFHKIARTLDDPRGIQQGVANPQVKSG